MSQFIYKVQMDFSRDSNNYPYSGVLNEFYKMINTNSFSSFDEPVYVYAHRLNL